MSEIQQAAVRLLDLIQAATGGHRQFQIDVGARRMTLTRMGLLESMFGDHAPSCGELEEWIVATAQNLGSDQTQAQIKPSGASDLRLSITVQLDDFQIVVEAFSHLAGSGDELTNARRERDYRNYWGRSRR